METKNQISFSYEVNKKVSEELSSVETIEKYIIDYLKISKFQKNLVVWKLPFSTLHGHVVFEFQKNLVVWGAPQKGV